MPSYDHGVSGLTGTIGVTVTYPDLTAYAARATAGITEPVAGSGVYHYDHPAAGTLLLFIFDGGVGKVGASCFDDGLQGASATALATVDTVVDAVKAKTDNLPAAPAATGDAMTLTAAYDNAKDDVLTPLAAAKAVVDAIPTTPLLADDYTAPDNATVAAIAADYAKTGEAAAAVVGLATEANATANKNAVIAAMPDIPPPDVGTTITQDTLSTGAEAIGQVMPYGVITAYIGTVAHYQFTADADGDFSYVLPDGSTWTLIARRAGYKSMTAEVTT